MKDLLCFYPNIIWWSYFICKHTIHTCSLHVHNDIILRIYIKSILHITAYIFTDAHFDSDVNIIGLLNININYEPLNSKLMAGHFGKVFWGTCKLCYSQEEKTGKMKGLTPNPVIRNITQAETSVLGQANFHMGMSCIFRTLNRRLNKLRTFKFKPSAYHVM